MNKVKEDPIEKDKIRDELYLYEDKKETKP
jgi:hypothetical protein